MKYANAKEAYAARMKQLIREWQPPYKFLLTRRGLVNITGKYKLKEEIPMNQGLMLHCGAEKVTRENLKDVLTPIPTDTWHPVPHYEVAELVHAEAESRGFMIANEEYGLNPSGSKMFGVLKFQRGSNPEFTRALGVRNSHDKSFALGLTVGLNIMVCDNLCFGGETTIHRKHTSRIEINTLIPRAFDNLAHQFIRLEHNVERLKMEKVSVNEARLITVKAAEEKAIPSCDIIPVLDEFKEPAHEEFKERNKWSLYNSFTELAKKYSPARADFCYRGLSKLFSLN